MGQLASIRLPLPVLLGLAGYSNGHTALASAGGSPADYSSAPAAAHAPRAIMLLQVVSIQPSELDVRDAELVDVAVEGIGDAAHMPSDAKGSCVEIDGQGIDHLLGRGDKAGRDSTRRAGSRRSRRRSRPILRSLRSGQHHSVGRRAAGPPIGLQPGPPIFELQVLAGAQDRRFPPGSRFGADPGSQGADPQLTVLAVADADVPDLPIHTVVRDGEGGGRGLGPELHRCRRPCQSRPRSPLHLSVAERASRWPLRAPRLSSSERERIETAECACRQPLKDAPCARTAGCSIILI
jgi:hypothetical protein